MQQSGFMGWFWSVRRGISFMRAAATGCAKKCARVLGLKSYSQEHAVGAESSADLGMRHGEQMILQLLWCI